MSSDRVTSVAADQFQACTDHKKLVLLYPWSGFRNAFLAYFLKAEDARFLYCRLSGAELPLEDWLKQVAASLDRVQEGLASQLSASLPQGDPAQWGEALVADLAAYQSGDALVLVIDEFDRTVSDDRLRQWINALVGALPDGIQLVFSGRSFAREPWYDALAAGEICVLGTEQRETHVMFTIEDKARPQLEVYAFGRGHVLVNGREIVQWDGALPRNLLFYLMDHPLATRDEIFAVFWPNLAVKEATNVFHVTKRKIGEQLSMMVAAGGNYELTQYKSGFYIPSEKLRRHYDVTEFLTALEQSALAINDDKEEAALARAIAQYRGPFLSTVSMDWSRERAEELKQSYVQALVSMARLHKRNNDWQPALGFFIRALREVPEREDIHREVMNIYLQQQRYDDAAHQYRTLETIVNDTLQIAPDPETQELFELVQANR